jgi:hypothetical protein
MGGAGVVRDSISSKHYVTRRAKSTAQKNSQASLDLYKSSDFGAFGVEDLAI